MEQANDIQEALGRSYGLPEDIDEEELEAELDALGDELDFEEEAEPSYLQESEFPELNAELADLELEVSTIERTCIKISCIYCGTLRINVNVSVL